MRSKVSTISVFRLRNRDVKIARPTAASAAATVMVNNTKFCPMRFSCSRLKATRLRLTAFIINSMEKSTMNRFLRTSTPVAPMTKRKAESTRYHSTGICTAIPPALRRLRSAPRPRPIPATGSHFRPLCGPAVSLPPCPRGVSATRSRRAATSRRTALRPRPARCHRVRRSPRATVPLPRRRRCPSHHEDELGQHEGRKHEHHPLLLGVQLLELLELPQVQEHDHEREQHQDGSGIHQHLYHGQEVGLGQQEDAGHVQEREHEQDEPVDDVGARDDAQGSYHRQGSEHDEDELVGHAPSPSAGRALYERLPDWPPVSRW